MNELILKPSVLAKCESFWDYFSKLRNKPTPEQSNRGNSLHEYVEDLLSLTYQVEKKIEWGEVLGNYLIVFRGIVDAIGQNEIIEIKTYSNPWSERKQTKSAIRQLTIYHYMVRRAQGKRMNLKVYLVNPEKEIKAFYVRPDYEWLNHILGEIEQIRVVV